MSKIVLSSLLFLLISCQSDPTSSDPAKSNPFFSDELSSSSLGNSNVFSITTVSSSESSSSSEGLPVTTAFYITGHEDDWQIFMGDQAYQDILNADEVVFIYLTAGEAGRDQTFWGAREQGALNSIAWSLGGKNSISTSKLDFDGNEVIQSILGHTISYFLRLPDGNGTGAGFSTYNYQSLSKLNAGTITSIKNVTNTANYTWPQLVKTIEDIIAKHSSGERIISFHLQDSDNNFNQGNHPDHTMGSLLAQEAIASTGATDITVFLDYVTSRHPINLDSATIDLKTGLFMAYDAKMQELASYNTIENEGDIYHSWLARTYSRHIDSTYSF